MANLPFEFKKSTNESEKKFYQVLCRDYLSYIGNKAPSEEILYLTEKLLSHNFIRFSIAIDDRLTIREQEFLYLVGRGNSLKRIAKIMRIKEPTIETYRASVLKKLLCNSLQEAVAVGMKYRFLS